MKPLPPCKKGHRRRRTPKGVAYCPFCQQERDKRWLLNNPEKRAGRSRRAVEWNRKNRWPQNAAQRALFLRERIGREMGEGDTSPFPLSSDFPDSLPPDLLDLALEGLL